MERYSGDQIKKTEMGKACGRYGERRGAYRVLVVGGEADGKKMYLEDMGVYERII
jgi:hypothetical protein